MPRLDLHFKKEQLYYVATPVDDLPFNVLVAGISEKNPDYSNTIHPNGSSFHYYQFEYVVSGQGSIEINNRTLNLSAGDFFFIRKNETRTIRTNKNDPMVKLYISAKGEPLDSILSAYNFNEDALVLKVDLKEQFDEIIEIIKTSTESIPDICNRLSVIILQIIQKVHKQRKKVLSDRTQDVALRILDYIESNLNRNLTLDELCRQFFLGKTQLISVFKRKHRQTPLSYHQKRKIDVAKNYLRISGIKTADLAEFLGFSDAIYFSKVFKKHTGMTVREYKSAIKKK